MPGAAATLEAPSGPARPRVRAECVNGPRPCPWTSCRHHLGDDARESCALDVADRGGLDVRAIARLLGVHPTQVIDIETAALRKLQRVARHGLLEELRPDHEVHRGVRPFWYASDELDEKTDAAIKKMVRDEAEQREREKRRLLRALGW